jgi:branched-chain amino acid transport system permease protein
LIMWAAMAPIVTGTLWGFPPWLAVLSGVVAAVGFGLIIEKVALRPFIGRSDDFTWILATLGCGVILEQLATEPFGGQDQAFSYALSRTPLTE